jgi:hypothetical protein
VLSTRSGIYVTRREKSDDGTVIAAILVVHPEFCTKPVIKKDCLQQPGCSFLLLKLWVYGSSTVAFRSHGASHFYGLDSTRISQLKPPLVMASSSIDTLRVNWNIIDDEFPHIPTSCLNIFDVAIVTSPQHPTAPWYQVPRYRQTKKGISEFSPRSSDSCESKWHSWIRTVCSRGNQSMNVWK